MNKAPITSNIIASDKIYMKLEHQEIRGRQ